MGKQKSSYLSINHSALNNILLTKIILQPETPRKRLQIFMNAEQKVTIL